MPEPLEIRSTTRETMYFMTPETGEGEYQLVYVGDHWKCTCKGYVKTKEACKHIHTLLAYLQQSEGAVEPEEYGMITPPANGSPPGIAKWVRKIHGKEYIEYPGLLALAHEKGLHQLGAELITVTETLAVALGWATFKDGTTFWEASDATPTNVAPHVKAHFPRIALTRAKARCLRDALNIGMVCVEELAE